MKNTDSLNSFGLEQYIDDGDVLYSHKDKQYFGMALDAVINHSMGLAVIGNNETALTHYSRILTSRLRKQRAFQLETFPPTNTEELLRKFNQLLAQMTMDEARQQPSGNKPVTLMLVNDANLVEPVQWTLLLQLLSDFPGINVRMVLFFNKATWPAYDETLKLLGRNLYRWNIEMPSTLEAKELFSAAQGTIYERETALFLNGVGLGSVVRELKIQKEADQMPMSSQQRQNMPDSQNDSLREAPILKAQDEGTKLNSGKQPSLLRGLMVAGVLGAAAFGIFYSKMVEYQIIPPNITAGLQREELHNNIFVPPPSPTTDNIEEVASGKSNQADTGHDNLSDGQDLGVDSIELPQIEVVVIQSQKTLEETPPFVTDAEIEEAKRDNKSEQQSLQH